MRPLVTLRLEKPADIARLRQVAAALAGHLAFNDFARTRAVTAIVEIGRNAIEYAEGGRARVSLTLVGDRTALAVIVTDQGRGIEDVEAILDGSGPRGPGLGLGLRGVRRIADHFDIRTGPEGTRVELAFASDRGAGELDGLAREGAELIGSLDAGDPVAQLTEQNRELLEAVAARDLLMQEIHHRTGNNLTLIAALIRMSKGAARTDETRQVLTELGARVSAVIRAHEQLQKVKGDEQVALTSFLKGVAGSAQEAFSGGGRNVAIRVTGDPVTAEGAAAIDLGLIVGELVTNAYKHAFSDRDGGTVTIEVAEIGEGLRLVVSDDGPGLPADADRPERSESLGWRMIRSLAQKHGGTIEVDGDDGFRVTLTFEAGLDGGTGPNGA